MIKKLTPFARFSWFVLMYNVLVVLWGAYVRASGSGAGCGAHWPLCNGVVVPRSPRLETIIEFIHRLSSGVAIILVVVLFIWAWRSYPKSHPTRLGVQLCLLFIVTESLVGAMLVLFEWVALNQSVARVISVSVHLVNTFLLLASLLLTAWWASGENPIHIDKQNRLTVGLMAVGLIGIIFLGVSGAITALGDTLFPSVSLAEGIRQDFAPAAHFLIRLRVWHPVAAIVSGLYASFVSVLIAGLHEDKSLKKLAWISASLVVAQLLAGLINLLLLAPIWMQMIHLLLADLVWLSLVAFSARLFRT